MMSGMKVRQAVAVYGCGIQYLLTNLTGLGLAAAASGNLDGIFKKCLWRWECSCVSSFLRVAGR